MIKEIKINTKNHKDYEVMIENYSSAMNVVSDCRQRSITDGCFNDKSEQEFGSWEGVDSYEEALDLMKNGYQPVVDKLKSKLNANKMGERKRISFQNNIVGAVPVVPLAMMGVPNNMIDMKMKPIKCKVLDIYYDMTCSCGTKSKDIIENGRKLLSAIVQLEKEGYRFNLYAMQSYSARISADMLLVKIKSATQPLDLKRVSFPLTHTAFFRVIGFDWYSRTPKGTYRSGYGHALSFEFEESDEMQEFVEQVLGKNSVYISGQKILGEGEEYIKEMLVK